jgi:hypothetical protein
MLTPDSIKTIISLTCNEASLHTLIMLQGLVKALQQTDAAITERDVYIDEKSIRCICEQTTGIFNRKALDDLIDGLLKDIKVYKVYLSNGSTISNIAFTEEELADLCK